MSKMERPLLVKLRRFAIVGLMNSAIDFAAFTVLVYLGLAPLMSNLLAWAVAVIFSFAVNSRWTFVRSHKFHLGKAFAKFAFSGSIISLGSSTIAVWLLPPLIGVFPAKIVGIAIGAALNFFAARWSIEDRLA